MSYYKILGLEREPFSTSPDPDFLYQSQEHKSVLTNLLIEIRLRRGLSVVLGDIGTGKTTLSRKLLQMINARTKIKAYIVLDPTYDSEYLFLLSLIRTFGLELPRQHDLTILDLKEEIKRFLFHQATVENEIIVLLIDEAQKLNPLSLETLRILLNYETNEFKLLQLILLGQLELLTKMASTKNLWDRISFKYRLNPLNQQDTRGMIEFRVTQAGYEGSVPLFADSAFPKIYEYTQGYPRRIAMLCHLILKYLVMHNYPIVDSKMVDEIADSGEEARWQNQNLLLKSAY